MSQLQFLSLLIIWLISVLLIATLAWFEFRLLKFNFHIFFSLIFLLIFYSGFLLTSIFIFHKSVTLPPKVLMQSLLLSTYFYSIYYITYKIKFKSTNRSTDRCFLFTTNQVETHLTWIFLMQIALICLIIFFVHNGFLLFKLNSYSQIFSSKVSSVSLKRFFYFFTPAMLIIYFLQQKLKSLLFFLFSTMIFGILTYIIVGGTRANIITSFAIFLFIGMIRGWISIRLLIISGFFGIVIMFWLALKRYGLDITSNEIFHTFFYLTRDTFSPWENLAFLLKNYENIEFQGLAPIVRDFYVFIPRCLWLNKPVVVLNTANYFTLRMLNNQSGLTISPTLIGSLIIMGGRWFILPGAIIIGLIIKGLDWLYMLSVKETNCYNSAILQSFCFSSIFNVIILLREGLDAFISRMVFFILIFSVCLLLSKFSFWIFNYLRNAKNTFKIFIS